MNEKQHEKEKSFIAKTGMVVTVVVGIGCFICGFVTGLFTE